MAENDRHLRENHLDDGSSVLALGDAAESPDKALRVLRVAVALGVLLGVGCGRFRLGIVLGGARGGCSGRAVRIPTAPLGSNASSSSQYRLRWKA